jgi:hypothetical protein
MTRQTFARALKLGALALAIGFMATSAQAQQPAAKGTPPTAAQVQLAKDIIDVSGAGRAFDPVVPSVMQQSFAGFVQQNPDLQKQLLETMNALRPDYEKRQSELVDIMAQSYASHFTEAELKELLVFYRSATGKKLTTELPIVLEESFTRAREWGAKLSGEITTRVREEMKKKGFTI